MNAIRHATREVAETILALMPFVNGVLGLIIVCYIMHRLLCCPDQYKRAERIGMGAIASGMVMATPALWIAQTPFDGWSFNVARAGVVLYIITGGLRRDRHARRNAEANEFAARWLARKEFPTRKGQGE